MLEIERGMLKGSKVLFDREIRPVSERFLSLAFEKRKTISDEQRIAVKHITQSPGAIKVVSGMAGTGKSYMLGAAREAWEKDGYKVYGAAIAGKAAQGLEEGSGIPSNTLHKTFLDIESGNLTLNSKSVIVIDEAGMVGTRLMAKVVTIAEKTGAQLVLVGDAKQLQPVEAGGPLKAIADRIGEAKLQDIRRQEQVWAREAVYDFAHGKAKEGLYAYAEKGLLSVSETRSEAREALIKAWVEKGVRNPEANIILVGTNLDSIDLNSRAQKVRQEAGLLGAIPLTSNSQEYFEGDRVVFTRNSLFFGVKNGHLGSITKVDPIRKEFSARLDGGGEVKIALKHFDHVKLGYAITTHKSQGMTADNSYVLLGGSMQDREFSYVQISRAKKKTRLFTDRLEAGDKLTNLAYQMSNSRQKDLALSVKEKPKRFNRPINLQQSRR